jgi:hypothetical protein
MASQGAGAKHFTQNAIHPIGEPPHRCTPTPHAVRGPIPECIATDPLAARTAAGIGHRQSRNPPRHFRASGRAWLGGRATGIDYFDRRDRGTARCQGQGRRARREFLRKRAHSAQLEEHTLIARDVERFAHRTMQDMFFGNVTDFCETLFGLGPRKEMWRQYGMTASWPGGARRLPTRIRSANWIPRSRTGSVSPSTISLEVARQ